MTGSPTAMVCAGCGYHADPDDPLPFRCPRAGRDDVDHVMRRELDAHAIRFPEGDEANPFVRYRTLFHSYHLARRHGLDDADHIAIVEELDRAVASVDGRGFGVTPFARADALSDALGFEPAGGVWVKDETGGVAGSHKARHLMGVMLYLLAAGRAGLLAEGAASGELAIASCGNAGLAAAVIARAAGRSLRVFVPAWADPAILDRLRHLGAAVVPCQREPGSAGDPAYLAFREAIAAGAIPFTCQGPENGLAIEGGATLGYEIVSSVVGSEAPPPDRVVVQAGGGALASSTIQAFDDAIRLGVSIPLPRVHAVQPAGVHPLERAYRLLTDGTADEDAIRDVLARARRQRSRLMWPWETEPRSVATGILDDETYDWAAILDGTVRSGGHPIVVTEDDLRDANSLAADRTGIPVDHTGSAGLAGVLSLRRTGGIEPSERVAVLFTGRR
ncbi:MAG TPA: PLP-dependent lyase/thiolase, partial [Actinomycetota bacterium]|nr:PLP-dependent lyase/thiolase [Actinomycetota bacterium]